MSINNQRRLAERVGKCLSQQGLMLVTAESCTGGGLGQAITAVAGCSVWYDRGFITYSNISKCDMLGVSNVTLDQYGSVSEQVAQEMAAGALHRSHAQVSVSITGIAGPDGGSATKPVGMICFAWVMHEGLVCSGTQHFKGDRDAIRRQSVVSALQGVLSLIQHDATL